MQGLRSFLFWRRESVPVLLAGMWPSRPGDPATGTSVSLIEKPSGPTILEGYSDERGQFRADLPVEWVGRHLYLVVREASFKYDYFNPIKVERWGLFLAVRQEKDLNYSGNHGAKALDPTGWASWNATQQYVEASNLILGAVRRAKIAWPLRSLGFGLALVLGALGFIVHPALGFVLGVGAFLATQGLSHHLLARGF